MRTRLTWLFAVLMIGAGALVVLSLGHGQDRAVTAVPSTQPTIVAPPVPASRPALDVAKLTPLQRQMYLSAQRGADWLVRTNRPDGHFDPGYVPSLQTMFDSDHYLRQVGAAFALARTARFTGNERYAAIARQAVLTLLLSTALDNDDPTARHTTLPFSMVNRLGSAGLLLMAIHEMPAPGDDVLEQGEQLCTYIRKQQRSDGSLRCTEGTGDNQPTGGDPEGLAQYPGAALYGLMLSQRHRPAAWKTEVVQRSLGYYRTWWRNHKSLELVPWLTAAYTEAYLQTREPAYAECVAEMNDWLCGLQFNVLDRNHPQWYGGFVDWSDAKPSAAPPQINSAASAESLAEACRMARQAGDPTRYQRYSDALERCLQFVVTLQYTEANTRHFADWYRPVLIGGFYATHQDGRLRLDYTQHAVCALVQYLSSTIQAP